MEKEQETTTESLVNLDLQKNELVRQSRVYLENKKLPFTVRLELAVEIVKTLLELKGRRFSILESTFIA